MQNRNGFETHRDEIPDDWFKKPNIPHLTNDDISTKVCYALSESKSYVLSRFIGRKDILNDFDLQNCNYVV